MRELSVPNLRKKRLATGGAYYWEVPTLDRAKGCKLVNEALGTDLPIAITRAGELNKLLHAWRKGDGDGKIGFLPGTVGWMFRQVERHPKFKKTSKDTQRSYLSGFRLIEEFVLPNSGRKFGEVPLAKVLERHVDKLYEALQWVEDEGEDGKPIRRRRLATANAAIRAARRAWSIGKRAGWVSNNPFSKPELEQTGGETRAATREEVDQFIAKADEMERPSMALAAMLAFELCQREGDVIETISWTQCKHPVKTAGAALSLQRRSIS